MASPVLDITTNEEDTVTIDRVPYRLRSTNDLTLTEFQQLQRHSARVGELLVRFEALDDAESRELSRLLDLVCRTALDAPRELIDKIGDVHRATLFRVFTELLTPRLERMRATVEANRLAGRKPSPDSSASTAVPSRRGSRKRRSASSGRTSK